MDRTHAMRPVSLGKSELRLPFAQPHTDRIAALLDVLERADCDVAELRRVVGELRDDLSRREAWAVDRLQMAIEAADVGIWDFDVASNRLTWNVQLARILGLDESTLWGDPAYVRDRVHPDDWPHIESRIDAALRGDKSSKGKPGGYTSVHRILRPDGTVRWVSAAGKAFFDAKGRPIRVSGTVVDVSDEQQETEDRLRAALSKAPASVYANDSELRYTWIYNPRFGFTDKTVLGRRDEELLPLESVSELIALKRRVLESGKGERRQITTQINGAEYTFDVTAEPQRDSSGNVSGVIVATYDVSAIARARRDAEMASVAKDRFLAALSHELRTPLTPVLTAAQLLENAPDLAPAHRQTAHIIRRNVELQARLIDDLLDLTRVARGKLELHVERFDIHRKLGHVLRMCADEIEAKRLTVATSFNAQEPELHADAARVQQVLWNLVKNAIKFTPAGGRIELRTRNVAPPNGTRAEAGNRLEVAVIDDGVGIDGSALPLIFDAFEQGGRDVTRQFGGLGLGLAISRAIAEAHGGTIVATSDGVGKGTTMTVLLPQIVRQPELASRAGASAAAATAVDGVAVMGEEPLESRAARTRAIDGSDDGPRDGSVSTVVLVVDDHPDTREIVSLLLESLGCKVLTAGSVADALAVASNESVHLVLSDIGLPDGTGLDLMRELKSRHQLRGIALSGYGMEDDIERCKEAGFEEHLLKPVSMAALDAAIRRVMATMRA